LARDLADRLKSVGGAAGDRRRILPKFDLLNAGRLVLGFGALLLMAGLVAAFSWLSGLRGFETTGTVTVGSPVYACPGGPQLGEVFEGEKINLIGRSPDQVWLVVRDGRGPGNRVYVLESVVAAEGDVTLLSTRECEPGEGAIAAGQTTTAAGENTTIVSTIPTTTTPGETTTTEAAGPTGGRPRRRATASPGTTTTTTTTRPGVTTTTKPGVTTTKPGVTTTTKPGVTTTTSASTSTSAATTTTTEATTTTTEATTTTTEATTTTTEATTTTTEATTTTTEATTTTAAP
jgi:hypothetical protein